MKRSSAVVSAILVLHKSAKHLPDLLPPLVAAADEIVVVDNASDDCSEDLVARFAPDAKFLRLDDNRGFAAGVNRAASVASGTHLLLINPDVRLVSDTIPQLRDAAARYPDDILGPVVMDQQGRVQPTRGGRPSLATLLGEQLLVPESAVPGTWPARLWHRWRPYDHETVGPLLSGVCLLVPRPLWDGTGPMDEGYFLYWEEIDWQLRAHLLGAKSVLVPAARVVHHRSSSSDLSAPRKAELMAVSGRRFVQRWLSGWRHPLALLLLGAGQLVRLTAWSVPPLRSREQAATRRAAHAAYMRALVWPHRRGVPR